MKIVVLDGYTLNPGDISWQGLEKMGQTFIYDRTQEDEIIERVGDAEIVFTNKTPLSRETLTKLPWVKYIGVLATGYNVVDLEAAKLLNMVVTNIPDYGTDAVAQFVFSLLLEICNNVKRHHEEVQKGTWTNCMDFCFWKHSLIELTGKKMGIIGTGRIGKATARIAQSFGMKILAYSRHPEKSLVSDTMQYVSLNSLFEQSDVISLHCPLTDDTKGIINRKSIEKMKDGVIVINTSRGALIVEEDLVKYLQNGKVFAAAMDVLEKEPPAKNNPLLYLDNCIITPHIAWAAKESRQRLMNIAITNLEQYLKGQAVNVVNQ